MEPVANVLGAGYAASVRYWQYLKGLQGLSKYGNDESLISFKVWREGGRCLLVKDVVIGHIYRSSSPYKHYREEEVANYLLVSYLIFPQAWYCRSLAIALRKDPALYGSAALHLQQEEEAIESQKEYLSSIFTVPFASVLQLHRERMADTPDLQKMKATLAAVNDFVKAHPVTRGGLYEGRAGQLLWFCHYAHLLEDDSLYGLQRKLWNSLEKDILYRALPWNFAQGVSGVGWMLMYLYAWGLLDAYPEQLLEQIDKQLQEVDADRLPAGMDEGVGGILAYAVLRLKTGTPQWDNKFAEALRQAAMRVPSETTELPSIYYAVFYTELLKRGTKVDTYLPHINEWLKPGQHLPANSKYWSPVLMDGCIGAVINLLTSINNHKKTICDEA